MPPPTPPTLLPAAIVVLALGAMLAVVQNFFVGLTVLGLGLYLGSLELRRYLAALPRCPGCTQPMNTGSAYCPNCGTPVSGQ